MQNNNQNEQKNGFYARMTQQDASYEVSERRFNLTIGALLTYGFLITFGLCKVLGISLTIQMAQMGSAGLIIMLLAYFGLSIAGSRMLVSGNNATAFIGYNLIVIPIALLLSTYVNLYEPYLVTRAAMMTAIITVGMMAISAAVPDVFQSMGRSLGISLLMTLVVSLIATFLFPRMLTLIDYIVVAIMALYVGFDWSRAQRVQCTTCNAIAVSASLYLDIMNIFIRLLRIMGRKSK